MSTPTITIPTVDAESIRGLAAALTVASRADGSDALATLVNALMPHIDVYLRTARGEAAPPPPSPSVVREPRISDVPEVRTIAEISARRVAERAMMEGPARLGGAALEALSCVESARRVLMQDHALGRSQDPGTQTACDSIAWRLRDAAKLLETGTRNPGA
jgi:hypothetical protein